MNEYSPQELRVLFVRLSEGNVSDQEMQALDVYLADHPEAVVALARFMAVQGMLIKRCSELQVQEVESDTDALTGLAAAIEEDSVCVIQDLSEKEQIQDIEQVAARRLHAFLYDQARQRESQQRLHRRREVRPEIWPQMQTRVKHLVRMTCRVAVGLAAVLVLMLTIWGGIQTYLRQRVVATLGPSQQAQWAVIPQSPELRPGRLELMEGCAQLTFGKGAQVLLQAPCLVDLLSTQCIRLESGTVTAQVPPLAKGFTVQTESTEFVDYGTEFGVAVDIPQQAALHVFEGEVEVKNEALASQRRLTRGQGVLVNQAGQLLTPAMDQSQTFLRALPDPCYPAIPGKRLDLADLIGGGQGYGTGRINQGIHLGTGQTLIAPIGPSTIPSLKGYCRLPSLRCVDGVFVPNGAWGDVTVSSTGLIWTGCPVTHGTYFEGIINGVPLSRVEKGFTGQGQLDGTVYGTTEHPGLNMHPNAAITYDLHALHRASGDKQAVRFTALCGITDNTHKMGLPSSEVTFWVLVDGQPRLSHRLSQPSSRSIDVSLEPCHRFLTLATTCSGDIGLCWAFWGDPMLDLALVE